MLVYLLEKCNGAAAESASGHSGPVDALHLRQMSSSKRLEQGVTRRCRLSWLTNSDLVYEPQCGGRKGGCVV